MSHSGVSSYVDNDNTRAETAYFSPKETLIQLDTQLGPCLRRRAGGSQSTAPQRPADLVTAEERVDYVDQSDDPKGAFGRPLGRSPFPFPNTTYPSSPPSLSSVSSAAPSSKQPLPTPYKPEQPQHNLNPYIPIPTPFEYADDDGDDFRGFFDFDRAWAGSYSDPNMTASQQLEGSQELAESPQTPGLSSSPSSTGE
ncbi:hypothetical protein M378DRAFT_352925 [Amanita muscaria Koide BX008]|uniref:Uncharacterized protein n=1 Tax=Amanita muscaria (strain Koide BX008) TaxID=946122 RepID=A0A0C2XBW4_AMAMK|nr:hypothetical protein M378DRAFT_352925 [Amanita muscaria Koide BX008]